MNRRLASTVDFTCGVVVGGLAFTGHYLLALAATVVLAWVAIRVLPRW